MDLFCAGKNFEDYSTFSDLIDMVYGDTTSVTAQEIGALTSDKTYNLMFNDWANPKGVAGKINTVLMQVSKSYNCKTTNNKRTKTAVCSDMEFFALQYAAQKLTMDPYLDPAWTVHDKLDPVPSFKDWGLDIPFPMEYHYYQEKVIVDGKPNTVVLPNDVVARIFDKENGFCGPKYGTILIKNIVGGDPKWLAKATLDWGSPVENMYETFRYMIENVWMSGAFQENIKTADWLSGFETTDYKNFGFGDYYRGAWKDLEGFVSPVFKENYPLLTESELNIHTGNRTPLQASMMRLVNNSPFANRLKNLYTGEAFNKTSVNPWGEDRKDLGACTNGHQFRPFIYGGLSVCIYDPLTIRNDVYKPTKKHGNLGDLEVTIYDGEDNFLQNSHYGFKGLVDSGVSYQLDYVTALKGGKGLDASLFENLQVDGKPYAQLKASGPPSTSSDFYVEVNPDTGFVTKIVKKTTTYMLLDPARLLPFYSLTIPKATLVPIFDSEESIVIGEKEINAKFSYIKPLHDSRFNYIIAFSVVGGVLFFLGIIAHICYMQRKRRAGPQADYQTADI